MALHSSTANFSGQTPPAHVYDAILFVGFGGPEHRDDVMPFLENVTRGRGVPRDRLLAVAEHYDHFGGVSPYNAQVRELIRALEPELAGRGITLPFYCGNRNWHPMLEDTLAEMTARGVRRALAIVLAAYSSYSSFRQYREDIARAQTAAGASAPEIDKVRVFYNHPEFIAANAERLGEKLESFTALGDGLAHLAFTAHSIPLSMALTCDYEKQLLETCRLVAEAVDFDTERWALVFQSRSGRPEDPWLGPDILDHLKNLKERGVKQLVVHPIGFLSDHLEVLYDLDVEARVLCDELGLEMVRSRTVGAHPRFVTMLRMLVEERIGAGPQHPRAAVGIHGPSHDVCPESCCLPPARPTARRAEQPGRG